MLNPVVIMIIFLQIQTNSYQIHDLLWYLKMEEKSNDDALQCKICLVMVHNDADPYKVLGADAFVDAGAFFGIMKCCVCFRGL